MWGTTQYTNSGHLDPRQDEDDDEGTERVRVEKGGNDS